MEAFKEQTKERGAQRAALTHTHLLKAGLPSRRRASYYSYLHWNTET